MNKSDVSIRVVKPFEESEELDIYEGDFEEYEHTDEDC